MYKILKGSIISKSQYFVTLVCKIVSEVEESEKSLGQGAPTYTQQKFKAQVLSVNGDTPQGGRFVDHIVGGAYGASINVEEY